MVTYDIQNTLNYTQIKSVCKTNQNTNRKNSYFKFQLRSIREDFINLKNKTFTCIFFILKYIKSMNTDNIRFNRPINGNLNTEFFSKINF